MCNEQQLVDIMQHGLAARAVSATGMNAQSSRSHCVVTVRVNARATDGTVLSGKLSMVDLAGSERQDKTGAAGQQLVEGSQINKSLSECCSVVQNDVALNFCFRTHCITASMKIVDGARWALGQRSS